MATAAAVRWNCTGDEYHAHPAIGQSDLKLFISEPELFEEKKIRGVREEGEEPEHFRFGHDLERLIFYGELPGVLIPQEVLSVSNRDGKISYSRRGRAWTAWRDRMQAEHGPDVLLLKREEWDAKILPLLRCRDSIQEHEKANALMYGEGDPHLAIRWIDEETGIECKCQLDILHLASAMPIIVDLKTARTNKSSAFRKHVLDFGYHIQSLWYREGVYQLTGERYPFVFVVVRNQKPYNCETFTLHEDWDELAERKIRRGLRRLRTAMDSGRWRSRTHGKIHVLKPPPWAFRDEED